MVIPRSNCKCLTFYRQVGDGSLTERYSCSKYFAFIHRIVHALTFEAVDIETSFLVWWYLLTISMLYIQFSMKCTRST